MTNPSNDYPVKCFSGATRLQSELAAAFNKVAPTPNWKAAIDVMVHRLQDMVLISDAVVHFTGATPTFAAAGGDRVRVQAPGYYATIGA